jgi:hypothetical protein
MSGPFKKEDRQPTTDLATVESQRHDVFPEEFPDGPYGAATNADFLGKDSPWLQDQRAAPRFSYENKQFHEGIPKQVEPTHPTHDEEQP